MAGTSSAGHFGAAPDPRRWSTSARGSTSPATSSSTPSPRSWESTASRNMQPMLGLGQKTGIDLPQEASGVMPVGRVEAADTSSRNGLPVKPSSVGIGQGASRSRRFRWRAPLARSPVAASMVRPHVTNPTDLPAGMYRQAARFTDVNTVPIDPKNWETTSPTQWRRCSARRHVSAGRDQRSRDGRENWIGSDRS